MLSQGPQNSDGTWPITATSGSCVDSATLDQYGDLVFPGFEQCHQWFLEYRILGSGDVTSQAYVGAAGTACYPLSQSQWPYFLENFGTVSGDYPIGGCEDQPLWKSQTDLPALDSPSPDSSNPWVICPQSGSPYTTCGAWQHIVSAITANKYVEFAGRFVFEQSGGAPTDGCWFTNSKFAPTTSVITGGGWYVNAFGTWGDDAIGEWSPKISYYQQYGTLPCEITGPQAMFVDERTMIDYPGSPYTTDMHLNAEITPTELLTGVQPQGGQMVTECENYSYTKGVLKGKCK